MMALLRMELSKLFRSKAIRSLFVILFLLNIGIFAYKEQLQTPSLSAYHALQEDMQKQKPDKRYAWFKELDEKTQAYDILQQMNALRNKGQKQNDLLDMLRAQHPDVETNYKNLKETDLPMYTGSLESECIFLQNIRKEMDSLHQYHKKLDDIEKRSTAISSISIFSENHDDFSAKNIKKTADDYRKMKQLSPQYQLEKGITDALHFPFTDFLIILMSMAVVSTMVLEEKQKGLLTLIKTTPKGNWKTMMVKCIVMMMAAALTTILFFTANLVYMDIFCGLGNLQAPLISLASFSDSTLAISIWQFLLLFLTTKWLALTAAGALMLWVCVAVRNRIGCFMSLAGVLGIELLCYLFISEQGSFAFLKQINLISFMDTTALYQRYLNINLFSIPCTLQNISLWLLALLVPLLIGLSCFAYQRQQDLRLHEYHLPIWSQRFLPVRKPSCFLFLQEAYKLLWIQKGLFIIAAFVLLQGFTLRNNTIIPSQEERSWMQIVDQFKEDDRHDFETYIKKQNVYYEELHKKINALDAQYERKEISRVEHMNQRGPLDLRMSGEAAFEKVKEQYAYINQGKNRAFFTPYAYERLFLDLQTTMIPSILLLCFLIILLSDQECHEYQHDVHRLLMTTQKGRRSLRLHKLALALLCALVLSFIAYAPVMYSLHQTYGFTFWTASITSLPQFSTLPDSINIITFFLLSSLLKAAVLFCSVTLLLYLSTRWLAQRLILCIMMLLLVVPLLLSFMNISFLNNISLFPLLNAATYIAAGDYLTPVCTLLFYMTLSISALHFYLKER